MNDLAGKAAGKKDPPPVAIGAGAAAGGAAGGDTGDTGEEATGGGMAEPAGAVTVVVGLVTGAAAGEGIGRAFDPAVEDAYWRDNYIRRPYILGGSTYEDYGPAYRYGVESYLRWPDRSFEEVEADLGSGWADTRGRSSLKWRDAKLASYDAWQRLAARVERAIHRRSPCEPRY